MKLPFRKLSPVLVALVCFVASCRGETSSEKISQARQEATASTHGTAEIIAPLIDPTKLATLKGDRAANRRLRIVVYWLEDARRSGADLKANIAAAQKIVGYHGSDRARLDEKSLLRNLVILERLGCLDETGMGMLRRGNAPTITRGPYTGEIASIDHIIPRSIVPELDEALFNLEFMPLSLNQKKSALIGQRQRALAQEWNKQGVLSESGLQAVLKHQ